MLFVLLFADDILFWRKYISLLFKPLEFTQVHLANPQKCTSTLLSSQYISKDFCLHWSVTHFLFPTKYNKEDFLKGGVLIAVENKQDVIKEISKVWLMLSIQLNS